MGMAGGGLRRPGECIMRALGGVAGAGGGERRGGGVARGGRACQRTAAARIPRGCATRADVSTFRVLTTVEEGAQLDEGGVGGARRELVGIEGTQALEGGVGGGVGGGRDGGRG